MPKYVTLGDIQGALTEMKTDGMTLNSIEYVLERVYHEDFDKRADQAGRVSETFILGKGGSPHMDGTMVYPIRRKGKVGILANPRLSNQEVENLASAGMERDER